MSPPSAAIREALERGLRALFEGVSGVAVVERAGGWGLTLSGGEAVAVDVDVDGGWIDVGFAGWRERLAVEREEDEEDDDDAGDEALALALDLVAAALFGELRVIEARVGDEVLERALEVQVGGRWIVHARGGGLGLRGLVARLRARLVRVVRGNEGRVARPSRLQGARPSGLASAPWSGAAGAITGEPAPLAIDGELDLHNFSPKEVGRLVREYIEVCHDRGIVELRIIHGKGKGVLRRTVHAILGRHPAVESFRLGGHGEGSWGATMVTLRRGPDGREGEGEGP